MCFNSVLCVRYLMIGLEFMAVFRYSELLNIITYQCYALAGEGTRDEVGTLNVRTSPTWEILANFEHTAPGMGSLNSSKRMLESTVDTTSRDQRARKNVTRVT